MLTVHMVEPDEQIRRALVSQAIGHLRKETVDLTRWHELDAFISAGSSKVYIPFAGHLAGCLPTTHFRVQRDFPQLLSLIQAHALLHKCNRQLTVEGEIVATLDDYATIRRLMNGPLSQGLETAVPDNIRSVVELVASLQPATTDRYAQLSDSLGTSQREISEKLGRDQSVIIRTVNSAIELGYLANLSPGQGREARIVLGERSIPKGYVLPEADQLRDTAHF